MSVTLSLTPMCAAQVVGTVYLLCLLFRLVRSVARGARAYFIAPRGIYRAELKSYGDWAVVTGASDGIGRGYALELARQGLNIVLISRSKEKLKRVADEVEELKRKTLVVSADLSAGPTVFKVIAERLNNLDIGILVNNVGKSYFSPDFLLNVSPEDLYAITELNCQAMVQMTHVVLPGMVKRKRGVIVNLSSIMSIMPPQLVTVYTATKVFVNTFSEGIRAEYSSRGITVQTVMPGYVATAMTGLHPTVWSPSSEEFSRAAVATIGIQTSTFGYFIHAVMGFLIRRLELVMDFVMWRFVLARRKALLRK